MIEIPQAVLSLYPNAEFAGPANNGGYDDIRWHVKPDGITKAKVDTELDRLQADYDAKKYQRDRQYPSIGEQLDLQYWDKKNGTKKWEEAIDKVKADHPKG